MLLATLSTFTGAFLSCFKVSFKSFFSVRSSSSSISLILIFSYLPFRCAAPSASRTPFRIFHPTGNTSDPWHEVHQTEQGYQVTAVDLTRAMLDEAKRNAGHLADHIHFLEMDAQHLIFSDASFDAIVTRNLTWNLPDPKRAYEEWVRVLKPDGILLNFDANWYHYLFDDTAREGYLQDRNNTKEQGIEDENVGDGFDVMENIAARVPLSRIQRPQWDREVLDGLGVQVTLNEHIWNDVWSEEERINFSSTPMFLICAKKVIN